MKNINIIKILSILEKKYLFYIFLGIIFFISIKFGLNNTFYETDLTTRRYFTEIRNLLNQNRILESKKNIVVIGIDQKFFSKSNISIQGLHRGIYADVINKLKQSGASTIVVDIFFEKKYYFSGKDSKTKVLNKIFNFYDKQLSNSIANNTILATVFDFKKNKIIKPDSLFLKHNPILGHIHSIQFIKSAIHVGVYGFLQDKISKKIIYPLGLVAYKKYLENLFSQNLGDGVQINSKLYQDKNFIYLKIGNLIYSIPLSYLKTSNWPYIFIPIYITDPTQYTYYSLYDILSNNFSKSDIKDKIIFIGAIDPTLNDIKTSILGNIPGVLFHTNLTQSLINQDFIYILSSEKYFYFILGILILNILIIIFFKKTRGLTPIFYYLIGFILIITLFSLAISSIIKINGYYIYLPLATVIILTTFQIITALIYANIENFSHKEWFKQLTNIYLGKKIVEKREKIKDISTKLGEKKDITVYFSDIQGFTNISEKLNSEEIVKLLNIYFENQAYTIEKNHGIIDKFIGDAIMAFWETDHGPDLAIKSAILNILDHKKINEDITLNLGINLNLKTRIGIHFGPATVGDIGSSHRLNYTAIGDTVNLASRLEGINKFYGTNIIISETVLENIKKPYEYLIRPLDKITVKGKTKPVNIYEVIPLLKINEEKRNKYQKLINLFKNALNKYFIGDFKEALKEFENIIKLYPNDGPTLTFIERTEYLLQNPPESWDGIWKFTKK